MCEGLLSSVLLSCIEGSKSRSSLRPTSPYIENDNPFLIPSKLTASEMHLKSRFARRFRSLYAVGFTSAKSVQRPRRQNATLKPACSLLGQGPGPLYIVHTAYGIRTPLQTGILSLLCDVCQLAGANRLGKAKEVWTP